MLSGGGGRFTYELLERTVPEPAHASNGGVDDFIYGLKNYLQCQETLHVRKAAEEYANQLTNRWREYAVASSSLSDESSDMQRMNQTRSIIGGMVIPIMNQIY